MLVAAAALCWILSTQIGESADTTADVVLFCTISFAVPPVTQPPQLKPTIMVMIAPAAAPCSRRVSESPFRIAGISIAVPFGRCCLGARERIPEWAPVRCNEVGIEGPAALRWRFGRAHHALIAPQSRWPLHKTTRRNAGVPNALPLRLPDHQALAGAASGPAAALFAADAERREGL